MLIKAIDEESEWNELTVIVKEKDQTFTNPHHTP